MPPYAHIIREGIEAAMNKMTRNGPAIQIGLDLRAFPVGQAPSGSGILLAMNVGDLSGDQSMTANKKIVPVDQALLKNGPDLCPACLIR